MAWQPYCVKARKRTGDRSEALAFATCCARVLAWFVFIEPKRYTVAHNPVACFSRSRPAPSRTGLMGLGGGAGVSQMAQGGCIVAHTQIHPAQPVLAGPAVRWPVARPLALSPRPSTPRTRDWPLLARALTRSPHSPCPTPSLSNHRLLPLFLTNLLYLLSAFGFFVFAVSSFTPTSPPHVHSRCSSRPLPPSPSPPRLSPSLLRTSPSPPPPLLGGVSFSSACGRRTID